MDIQNIAKKLGLEADASIADLRAAATQKLEKLAGLIDKAPTDELRSKYQSMTEELQVILNDLQAESDKPTPKKSSSPLSQTKLADLPQYVAGEESNAALQFKNGDVLAGRYRIEECIGVGGMGAVYRAHDKNREQDIAVKVLLPSLLSSPAAKERFLDEARISSQLSHPNIVNVFDVQNDGNLYFITMELLEGQNLRQYLESLELTKQTVTAEEAVAMANEICDGLQHAHEHTVHRDIKPENIWITGEGRIKLMDFGIARVMSSSQMTKTGAAMGTAYYMAPEQLKGRTDIDGRADQYALGVMLYEMLSGHIPAGRVDSLCKVNKKIGKHLSNVVDKILAGNPDERYANITEAKQALNKKSSSIRLPSLSFGAGSGKAMAALVCLAVIAVGGLAATGHLKTAWDMVRPYTQEEVMAFKADAASAEGKIKTLSNRLDGARDAVRDRIRDIKFELRQLETDANRANGNEKKELEQKLAEQTELHRILEAQEELMTTYLIDSSKRGELNGRAAHAKDLMQTKAYVEGLQAYKEAVAGYENLLKQADASENVARYKYASQREKNNWLSTAPGFGVTTIPIVDNLERELATAYEHLQNEAFADAAPLLEKVAIGYSQATDAVVSGSKYRTSSTDAKSSWENYAKSRDLQSKFTAEYAEAFTTAESQWQSGDLVPASATFKNLHTAYSELEAAARDASSLKARAAKAKSTWDTYRSQQKMTIGLTDQYAQQFSAADAAYKSGEVVDAAKSFSDLDKLYQQLLGVAKNVNAKHHDAGKAKSEWAGLVGAGYAKDTHAATVHKLMGEAEKLKSSGSWTEAADRFVAAQKSYADITTKANAHRTTFLSSLSHWEDEVEGEESMISNLERNISSLNSNIYEWEGETNRDCSYSGWSAVADGLESASCEIGCDQQVWNGYYTVTQTDYACVDNCRAQASAKQQRMQREVEQCENAVYNAQNKISQLESERYGKQSELASSKSRLSTLQQTKPSFAAY